MSRPDSVSVVPFAAWAVCVVAAVAVSRLPGDPGPVPTGWLVVLGVLGYLAIRGSRAAWVVLVMLNVLLLGSFVLLALPIGGPLLLFYALALLALGSLLAVPVLRTRARRTALAG